MSFLYKKAVCREIPRSIEEDGLRMEIEKNPFCYKTAVQQHNKYIQTLKDLGVEVTELATDESLPDCVFVEDPVLVIDDTVLVNNPGAPTRRAESISLKKYFMANEPSKNIVVMASPAELDGGDVMFTGHEIFVGVSYRTNLLGVDMVRKTFPKYPVHAIHIGQKTLHLKSMMSMISDDIILCGKSNDANCALKIILEKATRVYRVVRVPDDLAANVLSINGKLVCQGDDFPDSYKVLSTLAEEKILLSMSELSKIDGALTCCSVLYN